MHRFLSVALSLLIASAVFADEQRHYIITLDGPIEGRHGVAAAATLGDGVEVQALLPGHRLLVRTSDVTRLQDNVNVRAIVPYNAINKLTREGRRSAASLAPRVNVNVVFHDDVTFAQARAAVEAAGGTIATPLDVAFRAPQRLTINIPPKNILTLAKSETVFGIYGRPLRPVPMNSDAAFLSKVTPLYSAPYNLDGSGVVLSMFEPSSNGKSTVDSSHAEFGGRVTVHDSDAVAKHGTHVAGTMIAQGLKATAKGMAPAATLHQYLVGDAGTLFSDKAALANVHSVADNNSWGFVLGWQQGIASLPVWEGGYAYFGGYDGFYSTPYDKVAHDPSVGVLFVHSSGNDGDEGSPALDSNGRHYHVADADGSILTNEVFCYSKDGSGTDCPAPPTCAAGASTKSTEDDGSTAFHCEKTPHPIYGPFNTVNLIASEKNIVAVGAVFNTPTNIASFSSRGPAADGRVKPDLVAQGVCQYSTMPPTDTKSESQCFANDLGYGYLDGTSMASPVVTGMTALLVQQWRQTFGGANPTPEMLKSLLIAGASDLGNPGPDYTFGFGLANAQASVDLIRADANTGSHIRTGTLNNGQTIEIPLTVSAAAPFRAVLGWSDPEVLLTPPDQSTDVLQTDKTLVNDLDLKIVDPAGNTVLPYVLDKNNPGNAATHGVNSVDNTEEVEIASPTPGQYKAVITGTNVAVGPQDYVFISTLATAGSPAPPCTDGFEPNDTPATAKTIGDGVPVTPTICTNDIDWFTFSINRSGVVSVTVTAHDTAVTVELDSPGPTTVSTTTVPAHSSATVTGTIGSGTNNPVNPAQSWFVKVTPAGTVTGDSTYALTANYNSFTQPHKRASRH